MPETVTMEEARGALRLAGTTDLYEQLSSAVREVATAREASLPLGAFRPMGVAAEDLQLIAARCEEDRHGLPDARSGVYLTWATRALSEAEWHYFGELLGDWAREVSFAVRVVFDLAAQGTPGALAGIPTNTLWPDPFELVEEVTSQVETAARSTVFDDVRYVNGVLSKDSTQQHIAEMLRIHPSTWRRWRLGVANPSARNAELVADVASTLRQLYEVHMFSSGRVMDWLHQPSLALGGDTPLDTLHSPRHSDRKGAIDAAATALASAA